LTLRQNFPPQACRFPLIMAHTRPFFIETRFTRSSEGGTLGVRPGDL
jgi:hypothetical protein